MNIKYKISKSFKDFSVQCTQQKTKKTFHPKVVSFCNENYYGYVLCSVCEMTTKAYKCIGWGSFLIETVLSDNEDFLTN